jgi:hypothetical protein
MRLAEMNREDADDVTVARKKRSAVASAKAYLPRYVSVCSEGGVCFHVFYHDALALLITVSAGDSAIRQPLAILEDFVEAALDFDMKTAALRLAQ